MHRFFVPPTCIDGDVVRLAGDVARQIARVLRARPGDRIVVLDDTGWEYHVVLDHVTPHNVSGTVTERVTSRAEPGIGIALYVAVLKSDRFEFVLQKGTELGVSVFVPVFCARSVPRDKRSARSARRSQRWQRIVSEAAEQSHRGRLPSVRAPVDFPTACDEAVTDRPDASGHRRKSRRRVPEGSCR